MLIYTLAMMLEQMMQLFLRVELYYKGLGDKIAIKNHSLHQIKYRKLPFLFLYIVAFSTATIMFVKARSTPKDTVEERSEVWDLNDLSSEYYDNCFAIFSCWSAHMLTPSLLFYSDNHYFHLYNGTLL